MKLYEISEMYHDFMFAFENGEIPDESFEDTLEAIEATFNDKADNIACMVKSYLAEAEAIKAEADKLTERAKAKKAQAERLKGYLSRHMLDMGIGSIESPRTKLTFRKNEAVEIADEAAFVEYVQAAGLDDYLTYKAPTPNKTAIKEAIKAGTEIQGAEIVTKQNLQIK